MRPQSIHVMFGWTELPFSKSNRRVSLSFFFVDPNDPSILCDRLMGVIREHSSTRFVTSE